MSFFLPPSIFRKKRNTLLTLSRIGADNNDTAIFINKVLIWWKDLYLKTVQVDELHNDHLPVEIRSPNDSQFDFIIKFALMVVDMVGSQDNGIKQLSKHTAITI